MPKPYPKFSLGQFNHVNKDLTIVDYYLKAKDTHDALLGATKNHNAALADYASSDAAKFLALKERLVDLTTPAIGYLGMDGKPDVPLALSTAIHRMGTLSADPTMSRRQARGIAIEVLSMFCTFDAEAYDKMGAKLHEIAKEKKDVVNKTSGAKGAATKYFHAAVKEWRPAFTDGWTPSASGSDNAVGLAAYSEAQNFVDTWRSRARLFLMPVTIEGTAIPTLAPKTRELWTSAYQRLGFDQLKKADVYSPYRNQKVGVNG